MRRGNFIGNIDWISILLFLAMVILGWLNIFSAVYSDEHPHILDFEQRYGKQFIWIIASVILAIVLLYLDHRFYEFAAYFVYAAAVVMLMAVLVVGKEINGAKSWFVLGSFQIQPSEFAKPAVALALAKYLTKYKVSISDFRTFLLSMIIIFTPAVLILLQPDTGSTLVYAAFILVLYREGFSVNILLILLGLVVIFLLVLLLPSFYGLLAIIVVGFLVYAIRQKRAKDLLYSMGLLAGIFGALFLIRLYSAFSGTDYFLLILSAGLTGIVIISRSIAHRNRKALISIFVVVIASLYSFSVDFAFNNLLSDYQQRRINVLLGFESDPQGAGYNVNQSKIAIGSGGFSGKGFLQGTQTKLNFVPEQSTDFIFCTVGEEWGFMGSFLVVGLFVTFLLRLLFLAERQRNNFARVYGYGIVSVFFIHFAVNIGMTIGLFPVIGIPLPFFSYGGSSLWAFTIMLFVFLRLDASRMEHLR